MHAPSIILALSLAAAAAAQLPLEAVVAWKPPSGGAGGLKLVDGSGAGADITGLDPATVGTTDIDGARSVMLTTTGQLFAGLGVDNRGSRTPRPLDLRRIDLLGNMAVRDVLFATVMTVPVNEVWHVSDIEERADGSLLVAATETLFTANPMPQTAAFLVDLAGNVTPLSTAGFPAGSLRAVADAGDRFVGAFEQSFFIVNVEVTSFPIAAGPAPFRVQQFVNVGSFGGLDADVDGTLIAAVSSRLGAGSVVRLPHAPDATPVLVAGTPAGVTAADAVPAAGLMALFALPRNPMSPLVLVDTLAGGARTWSAGVVDEPIDLAVRRNPTSYGPASPARNLVPYLGTTGGLPQSPNPAFGLRVGGTPGSQGVVFAGLARGRVPTPFGLLLLDPTGPLVVLAPVGIPAGGEARLPLPLGPGIRATVALQAVLFLSLNPLVGETTQGVELAIR
jgi:hypothetical protein